MDKVEYSAKLFSDFIYVRTYSRYLWELGRRETWEETVDRYCSFIFSKCPNAEKIPEKVRKKARNYILNMDVMPSMRALWSAGSNAERDNTSMYNCAAIAMESLEAFGEIMYILLAGAGVGFSVEKRYITKLPIVGKQMNKEMLKFCIPDSREGWKQAIDFGVSAWFEGRDVVFDYCLLRPAGTPLLISGGYSSGPAPLQRCLEFIRDAILSAQGRKLNSIEVADIVCEIAASVVCGGVRRSSTICLCDVDDELMKECKQGNFHPRRFLMNISAVYRSRPDILKFTQEFIDMAKSGSGERGIINLVAARKRALKRRDKTKISLVNPCKPLNSLILTPDGYITFKEALQRDSLQVILPSGEIVPATKPFKTGENRSIYRIKLRNGSFIYGTREHLHLMRDGSWKRMDELVIGDHISYASPTINNVNISSYDRYELGILAGWLHGDGHMYKGGEADFIFGNNEFDTIDWFENKLGYCAKPHPQKPNTCKTIRTSRHDPLIDSVLKEGWSFDKSDLTWLYGKDPDFKLGFLRALFTADGSVRNRRNSVELYSIRYSALEVISNILREYGIYNYICVHNNAKTYLARDGKIRNNATTYKIDIPGGNFKSIGFLCQFKRDLLEKQIVKLPYRYQGYMLVTDIEPAYSVEDVYDITVDHYSHSFIDTGAVAHNCAEVALRADGQFCNLTEVVIRDTDDFDSVQDKVKTAVWLGCCQSSFTFFPQLRDSWTTNCEEERLLGVSLTGLCDNKEIITPEALKYWKKTAKKTAKKASEVLGINEPASISCVKPSGTVSSLVNSSAGMHSRYAKYYMRRVRISTHDALFKTMIEQGMPYTMDRGNHDTAIFCFPCKSPEGANLRDNDRALEQLEWYRMLVENWADMNVSCTIYVRDEEWLDVIKYTYDNFDTINGISFFPYDNKMYEDAPFEEITEELFHKMIEDLPTINFSLLSKFETTDTTLGSREFACAGNACSI